MRTLDAAIVHCLGPRMADLRAFITLELDVLTGFILHEHLGSSSMIQLPEVAYVDSYC